ncbi:MAG TPA: mechanosensitive ion channel family protein [Erysipelotrichaceae bacterium]|jgi:small conductance mechanosensitive channel|nr:mechanosensitive ion channel family protein [Erysipelotrichaceae bacterium]
MNKSLTITEKFIESLFDNLIHLGQALLIILIGYIISKVVSKFIMRAIQKSNRDEIILNFFHTCLRVGFGIVVAMMALSQLGVNVTSLLAVFTTVSAAIALALKDTLAEIVDGMKIMFSRPFVKGDVIEVDGVTGKIQEISLLYTFLLTLDNKRIVIPNSTMANSRLINYSSEPYRRVDLTFDVGYDCSIDHVKDVIHDVVISNPLCAREQEPFVRLTQYKDSSITFSLRAWTKTENYEEFKFNIVEEIKKKFDEEGIDIPYPQLDVHIKDHLDA